MTFAWLQETNVWQLAWSQLWQVTVLAVLIGAVVALFCRHRPHTAYLLWLLVILKCVTPPILVSPTSAFSWTTARWESVTTEPDSASSDGERAAMIEAMAWEVRELLQDPDTEQIANSAQPIPATSPFSGTWIHYCLGGVWAAGFVLLTLAIAVKLRANARLLRRANNKVDAWTEQQLRVVKEQLSMRCPVRLLITDDIGGPAVTGCFRPTIIVPRALLETRSDQQIQLVLAHELIHFRRGDTIFGFVQLSAQVLWWFHPLIWWANRCMTRERERSCDEEVVAAMECEPSSYAQSLLEVLRRQQQVHPLLGYPGVRALEVTTKRLEHIMKSDHRFHRRTPTVCWFILLLGVLLVLPGGGLTLKVAANQRKEREKGKSEQRINEKTATKGAPKKSPLHLNTQPSDFNKGVSRLGGGGAFDYGSDVGKSSPKQSRVPKNSLKKKQVRSSRRAIVIQLKRIPADVAADVVRTVYRDLVKADKKTGKPVLTIAAETVGNSLLLAAPDSVLQSVKKLAARIDSTRAQQIKKSERPKSDVEQRLDKLDILLATLTSEVRQLKGTLKQNQPKVSPLTVQQAEARLKSALKRYGLVRKTDPNNSSLKAIVQKAQFDLDKAKIAHAQREATLKLELLEADAELHSAVEKSTRIDRLYKKGFATRSDLMQAELNVEKAVVRRKHAQMNHAFYLKQSKKKDAAKRAKNAVGSPDAASPRTHKKAKPNRRVRR